MAIKHIFPHAVIAVVFVPGLKIFVVIMIVRKITKFIYNIFKLKLIKINF